MKIDPNGLCDCTHRRGVHLGMSKGCMHGNHPDRDRPDFEQYRKMYDACRCREFKEQEPVPDPVLDTDELDDLTGGNPYGHG